MLKTPILLITFNRPDHVRRVLTEIRKQKPTELYICQDGAREGNENDIQKVQEVRHVIDELVDWPCSLHTLYQEENLGCGPGPAAGITWFFESVEMGIVMEDDCLPHPDFFGYCEELLKRYKDDERVGFINTTLYDDRWKPADSYGFSRYMVTGAWAGWRRMWQGFDLDLHDLDRHKFFVHVWKLTHNLAEAEYWYYMLRAIQRDKMKKSYWDYQMQIHIFRYSLLTIHPAKNLVSNIGFDAEGTHTLTDDGRGNRSVNAILPLHHPHEMSVIWREDSRCWAKKSSKGFVKDLLFLIYHVYAWRNKKMI